jgi:hypothetical protein
MITTAGKNFLRGRIEANTALFSGTLYLATSTDATAPALGDTSISGEQTANGLQRQAVAVTHTGGTNVWTFSATFTYTGSGSTNIQKIALFDASTGGNLITEDVVSSTVFSVSGDNCPFAVAFSL